MEGPEKKTPESLKRVAFYFQLSTTTLEKPLELLVLKGHFLEEANNKASCGGWDVAGRPEKGTKCPVGATKITY